MAGSERKGVGRREFLKETAAGSSRDGGRRHGGRRGGGRRSSSRPRSSSGARRHRPAGPGTRVDSRREGDDRSRRAGCGGRRLREPHRPAERSADRGPRLDRSRSTGRDCWPTGPRRSGSSASSARRASIWSWWRTPPTSTTWWCAPLCSCYPWPTLGLPPVWYKSAAYRSRAVIEPRAVLREFGVELPDDVEVRVWDSTAEIRYLVLPSGRPARTGSARRRLRSSSPAIR